MTEGAAARKKANPEAVRLRQAVKARKPKFRTHESWRYRRVKASWRRPRGLDNKMRRKVKGWPKSVNVGYGGPRTARHLHPSGFEEVVVHTPYEAANVNSEMQAIRIAHSVGTRKRIQITAIAKERGLRVLNPLVRRAEEEKIEEAVELAPEEEVAEPEKPEKKIKKKPKRSKRVKRKKEVKTNES